MPDKQYDDIQVVGKVKRKPMKMTEEQQEVDKEVKQFKEELETQREELVKEREEEDKSRPKKERMRARGELSSTHNLEVLPKEETLNITITDLTRIIAVARGEEDTQPHLVHQLPEDASFMDRAQLTVDDALGEIGRGAHRMVDGTRDIVGGLIDIVTLGRAHRK